MTDPTQPKNTGFDTLLQRPLLETIWRRRTHRVSRGIPEVHAKSMTYRSPHKPLPLTELEEAILIAMTGHTGLTMPDRPFEDPATGDPIMAKPNLTMVGRAAGSPDNAQGTSFFMINDSGTYFIRKLPLTDNADLSASTLIEQARKAKVKILDRRIDTTDRDFPAYLDSNRFLSNLPGTTVFFPVVELPHQYINGMMYLLTQPKGHRPTIVDDRNFYRMAGVKKWVKNGFLNKDIKIPLGTIATLRTQIEADLLLQNLMLVADAMGLGAYIHGSISPPVMLGDPKFVKQYGKMLGFEFATPKPKLLDFFRWQVPPLKRFADLRTHPIGLRHQAEYLIQAKCPPYYPTMKAAVEDVMREKFGTGGIYKDSEMFAKIFKNDFGSHYLTEASDYSGDVIECVQDICTYIYKTHGRFPAHVDAIYVPGVWMQAHHVEIDYYDRFFRNGLTDAHRNHDMHWH